MGCAGGDQTDQRSQRNGRCDVKATRLQGMELLEN
jgi:hypothetical protein